MVALQQRTSWEVQVKEALQIHNSLMDTLLNRDRGLQNPGCWSATIKKPRKTIEQLT